MSRTEGHLLVQAQRRLFLNVMLQNFGLIYSLGYCCGVEAVEAPIEQSVTIRVSQVKNPKAALSSQKSHPCESCGPVLRDIFLLVNHQRIQHRNCHGVGHVQNNFISVHCVTNTGAQSTEQKIVSQAVWTESHLETAIISMCHGSLEPLVKLENTSLSAQNFMNKWLLRPCTGQMKFLSLE